MFLKNKNIIFKIRRSKVTDYAALRSDGWGSECLIFSYICKLGPFLGVYNLEILFFISEN